MTIKKLDLQSNLDLCQHISSNIEASVGWGHTNQIGLRCKPNSADPWFDSAGSLYDHKTKSHQSSEYDFTVWNLDSDSYLRQQIEKLQELEKFSIGRVRIMNLLPQRGLSVHRDKEVRYHLVLKTNPLAYFAFSDRMKALPTDVTEMGRFYHIPKDGFWYFVDTTKLHWVYNGGKENRIHIVVSGIKCIQ
jgi:hypothetical protein